MTDEIKKEDAAPKELGEGNNTGTTKVIDAANSSAERMEKATAELRKENERREAIIAREILGGRSSGNSEPVKKEQTAREYAQNVLKGLVKFN